MRKSLIVFLLSFYFQFILAQSIEQVNYSNSIVILDTIQLENHYLYRTKSDPTFSWIDTIELNRNELNRNELNLRKKTVFEIINGGYLYFSPCSFYKAIWGLKDVPFDLTDSLRKICNEELLSMNLITLDSTKKIEEYYLTNISYVRGVMEISFLYKFERWNSSRIKNYKIWIPFLVPIKLF